VRPQSDEGLWITCEQGVQRSHRALQHYPKILS
jgi:hypothetical protein